MPKFFIIISLAAVLIGCSNTQPNSAQRLAAMGRGFDDFTLRGDIIDYDNVEKKFVEAARNGDDAGIYALLSPLTKKDSSEKEVKLFVDAMKEYFRGYESNLKCKSIVPEKDEYGNLGFMFYRAFKRKEGGSKAYVMALIKENGAVYVSTVFRKFDPELHSRCRNTNE